LVRLTVGEGLTMVLRHQKRHAPEVSRLLQHPNIPTDSDP
jgi:hypothetical protein